MAQKEIMNRHAKHEPTMVMWYGHVDFIEHGKQGGPTQKYGPHYTYFFSFITTEHMVVVAVAVVTMLFPTILERCGNLIK